MGRSAQSKLLSLTSTAYAGWGAMLAAAVVAGSGRWLAAPWAYGTGAVLAGWGAVTVFRAWREIRRFAVALATLDAARYATDLLLRAHPELRPEWESLRAGRVTAPHGTVPDPAA